MVILSPKIKTLTQTHGRLGSKFYILWDINKMDHVNYQDVMT